MATIQEYLSRKSAPTSELEQIENEIARNREKLAMLGMPDPTMKPKPSALERVFGVLDTPGTGVRALLHNAMNDPKDKDLSAWSEMGKALRGEKRVEGADILRDQGVNNKWAQMLGGFLVDVVTDPTTYLTFGFSGAAKAAGSKGLAALVRGGDFTLDALRGMGIADDVLKRLAPLADDAGKIIASDIPKELSQELMTAAFKSTGKKGGVKFAGIPLGGENALSKAGFKTKDALRKAPGAEWFQRAFLYGDEAEAFMDGNEVVNAALRSARRSLSGKRALAGHMGKRFADSLTALEPDEANRMRVALAIGRQMNDPENANALRMTLEELGLSGQQLEQAMELAQSFKGEAADLLSRQRAAGIDIKDFGESYLPGVTKFSRGKKASQQYDDTLRALGFDPDTLLDPSLPTEQTWISKLKPKDSKAKVYNTPEDRLLGITRGISLSENPDGGFIVWVDGKRAGTTDDGLNIGKEFLKLNKGFKTRRGYIEDALDEFASRKADELPIVPISGKGTPISTELDTALLGGYMKEGAESNIALAEYQKELAEIFGDDDIATELLSRTQKAFTDDKATKGFLKAYDTVLNTWKLTATSLNLFQFPMRNWISNKFLQYTENLIDPTGASEALAMRIVGKEMAGKALDEAESELLDEMIAKRIFTSAREVSEIVGRQKMPKAVKWAGNVNEFVENQSRAAAYIYAKKKGLSPDAAAAMVDKALYSYDPAMLTSFEKNLMKRIVPFYTWMRRNTPHMVELLAKNPGKLTPIGHLQQTGQNVTGIDSEDMPPYLQNLFGIPLPNDQILSTGGVLPIADLERVIPQNPREYAREQMSVLSPLLKLPLELLFNKDLYRDSDISSFKGDLRAAPSYVSVFDEMVMGTPAESQWTALKEALGMVYRERADGEQYLAMNPSVAKMMKDLMPFMSAVARGIGPDEAQRFSQMTGVKLIPNEPEEWQRQRLYDDRKTLQDALSAWKLRNPGKEVPEIGRKSTLQDLLGGR